MKGSRSDRLVGAFAGFQVFVADNSMQGPEIVIEGATTYVARVTDTALGTIRSLEATVQGFEERATKLETDIADAHKRVTELEGKVGAPFEKEERYQQLSRRQSEIEEKLDLTKNQAPSQVEPADADENAETNSVKETQTEPVQRRRRAAIRV